MINLSQLNYKKIGLLCGGIIISGLLFNYVIFPPILKKILITQVRLKPGSQMREMYDVVPFPLIYKIYMFNVTNKDEVSVGGKPELQEIGPYVFEEWKIRVDQIDNNEEDTLEYTLKNTFIFNQQLSNGLTGNEIITMLHPLLTVMGLNVKRDREPLLPLISQAISEIFHKPQDSFWTGKVIDILFNGIDIDCTSKDFNAKATCTVFETGDHKTVAKPLNGKEHMFLFSFFGYTNDTDAGRYKIYRGIKNIADLGQIISYNDEIELDVWSDDKCNEIKGTDSTIFAPFIKKEQELWAFEPAMCRSLTPVYEKPSSYAGLPTLRYQLDLGDIRNDENLRCYCDDEDDIETCPVKGTMDLFKCLDASLIASMPHFYLGDESLLANIKSGLNPIKELHEIFVDFEIISGTPLSGAKRLQLNIDLKPIEQIDCMKNLPKMVFPVFWLEEGVNLNKTYVNMLKYQLFLALKIKTIIKYLCLIGGSTGGILSIILHFKKKQQVTTITATIPPTINEEIDIVQINNKINSLENQIRHNINNNQQQQPLNKHEIIQKY